MYDAEYMRKYIQRKPWAKNLSSIYGRLGKKGYKNVKTYLTLEDIETLWVRDKAHLMKTPTLDRTDSSKDYYFDNCRFIEQRLNSAIKRTNKINFEIAQEIRKRLREGEKQKELAKEFSISYTFISQIKHNRWYKTETYLPTPKNQKTLRGLT